MRIWEYDGYFTREYIDGKFTRFVPQDEFPFGWTSIEEDKK